MPTRRALLRLVPAPFILQAARGAGADFERIDTHIHIHRDAGHRRRGLKDSKWSGLDIVVCPTEGDEPFDLESKLDATLKVARGSGRPHWPGPRHSTLEGFQAPGFADPVSIARLRRSFDDGAIGVKVWKNIGMAIQGEVGAPYLLPDDPALLPVYEAIEKADKTLIAHLAEPDGAWLPLDDKNPELPYYSKNPRWHMLGKGAPPKEAILAARDHVLARHPRLRIVGCHLGSDEDDLGRLAMRLDAYPNFAVDTAARVRYLARGDRDRARAFLIRYQDRILYATDFSLRDVTPEAGAETLQDRHERDWAFFSGGEKMDYEGRPTRGLALPDAVLRKLFRENARRWLPGIGV